MQMYKPLFLLSLSCVSTIFPFLLLSYIFCRSLSPSLDPVLDTLKVIRFEMYAKLTTFIDCRKEIIQKKDLAPIIMIEYWAVVIRLFPVLAPAHPSETLRNLFPSDPSFAILA